VPGAARRHRAGARAHEQALVFGCGGESLVGVLALPDAPSVRGVLIVVGGPQYRAGSHRQFTLLARELARSGVASLRFDYRGMGDSSGPARSFEAVDEDIGCALERLLGALPPLLMYAFLMDYYIAGLTAGATKG